MHLYIIYISDSMATLQIDFEKIKKQIDSFFENDSVEEILFIFYEPIKVSREDFEELVDEGILTNGAKNNDKILDVFEYYEGDGIYIIMQIEYSVENANIYLLKISLWRQKKK